MKSPKVIVCIVCIWLAAVHADGQTSSSSPSPPSDAAETNAEIQRVEGILPRLPDQGPALYLLAHDFAHLGNTEKALSLLQRCMALGEGFDPEDDSAFRPLSSNQKFRKLIEDVHRRYPVVHRAHDGFSVAEKELIPEGLAASQGNPTLYMGSLNLRKIVKIAKDGKVSDFTRSGKDSFGPICGLKVEPVTEDVWANVCRDSGVRAELLHFDQSGELVERFPAPGPAPHLFNDLVLSGKNEIYLTDSLAHRAYRFNRTTHAFSEVPAHRELYYPNGIAISDDGQRLYIADAFGMLLVDLQKHSSQEVDPGKSNTLSGTDGLYWYRNSLVAVQNGLGKPRVARFLLSPDGGRVTQTRVLEYRTSSVELPTTGAIEGTTFYFMANTQLDNFQNEKVLDPAKLQPVRIVAIELTN